MVSDDNETAIYNLVENGNRIAYEKISRKNSKVFIKEGNKYPTNLGDAAVLLGVKHDAHNPLSDSMITMEYFKFLLKQTSEESMIRKIPNKAKVLDIIANGSCKLKGNNK